MESFILIEKGFLKEVIKLLEDDEIKGNITKNSMGFNTHNKYIENPILTKLKSLLEV